MKTLKIITFLFLLLMIIFVISYILFFDTTETEIKLSKQAFFKYWYFEVAPWFWNFLILWVPLSFFIIMFVWYIGRYLKEKENDRIFEDDERLKNRIRNRLKKDRYTINIQFDIIRRLSAQNREYKMDMNRIDNVRESRRNNEEM